MVFLRFFPFSLARLPYRYLCIMNAYPHAEIAWFGRHDRNQKALAVAPHTRTHTHTDWSLARTQKRRRQRHIAININCTRVPHCRTVAPPVRHAQNGKRSKFMTRTQVCCCSRKFHLNCRMYFLWKLLLLAFDDNGSTSNVQQATELRMMAGSTLCARDTNHYDAIKLCRVDFVFFIGCIYHAYIVAVIFESFHQPARPAISHPIRVRIYSATRSQPNYSRRAFGSMKMEFEK